MESIDSHSRFLDNILDFSSDIGEEENDDEIPGNSSKNHHFLHHQHRPSFPLLPCRDGQSPPFPEFVEEELEWISNKDAFPMVESLVDIMPNHPSIATSHSHSTNHQSPISVLENSSSSFSSHLSHGSIINNNNGGGGGGGNMMINLSTNFKVPGKARSKHGRKRRKDLLGEQFRCFVYENKGGKKPSSSVSVSSKPSSTLGRKCQHCGSEKTPQWRAGPFGPKTLCNACGVRYKSGRLCEEYRPASSPTFSSELHSNSHRKIIEMRRQRMPLTGSGLKPAEIG